jgi:hypothetical protein
MMMEETRPRGRTDRRHEEGQDRLPEDARVREADLEPFAALRYIARLFKVLAVLLLLLLAAEVVLGLMAAGTAALAGLLVDATRLLVFAAFLWAGGDLALVLVETNHDLRATRIIAGRLHHELEALRATLEARGTDRPGPGAGPAG